MIELTDAAGQVLLPLVAGFQHVRRGRLVLQRFRPHTGSDALVHGAATKAQDPTVRAMAFTCRPREFKGEAYENEARRPGGNLPAWQRGRKKTNILESQNTREIFEEAVRNGVIRWIFCGHDHLNTLSL